MSSADHLRHEPTTAHFPSMAAMRDSNLDLLRRHRGAETVGLLDDIEAFIRRVSATGAVLDAEADREVAQSLLNYWATVLYRAGRNPPDEVLADFDFNLAPELDESARPYVGLDAFEEATAGMFFGRGRMVEAMVNVLRGGRLLAVFGSSGSGKSSAVLAGLLPALKSGAVAGSERWRYCPYLVPGHDPLASLSVVLEGCGGAGGSGDVSGVAVERPSVIVIDQFEEVFTLCTDDDRRRLFVEKLLELVQSPEAQHRVIITLRTDYESYMARLPEEFMELYERARVMAPPLTAADLREAIEGPARRIGLKFEAGLVEELVKEVLGEPAGLPLLQFSLLLLWRERERNRVTWEAYHRLGGARRGLAKAADILFDRLLPEDQRTAKRILLRLARPGLGAEVTRNRVKRQSLMTIEDPDRVNRVLSSLINAGLVRATGGTTPDHDQVEIAHEALVRNWPRLVDWLEQERGALMQRLRLTAAAEQWLAYGKDSGALLSGTLLQDAMSYSGADDLSELETEFVRASLQANQDLEQSNLSQRQEATRLRRLLWVLLLVYLITIGVAALVWALRADA